MSATPDNVIGMSIPQSVPQAASPLPGWTERVGVFDLETTGVDVAHDRIVTAHVGVLDGAGGVVNSRNWIADPGIPIPATAAAVHGISTERARAEGRPATEVVAEILASLRELFSAGVPVVAYNAPYDFSLLGREAVRHGLAPIAEPAPVVDPLVIDRRVDRFRRGKRTLEAVCVHYGVELADAHDAGADAVAAGRVAQAIAHRHGDQLPGDAATLHLRQIDWAREQADSLTEYFVRIGRTDPHVDGSWPIR